MRLVEFYSMDEARGSYYYTIQSSRTGNPILLYWEEGSEDSDKSYDVLNFDNIDDIANELARIYKKDQSFASQIMDAWLEAENNGDAVYVDRSGIDFVVPTHIKM